MAGFTTWASFAGHPSRSATAGHALTFNPDHTTGLAIEKTFGKAPLDDLLKVMILINSLPDM